MNDEIGPDRWTRLSSLVYGTLEPSSAFDRLVLEIYRLAAYGVPIEEGYDIEARLSEVRDVDAADSETIASFINSLLPGVAIGLESMRRDKAGLKAYPGVFDRRLAAQQRLLKFAQDLKARGIPDVTPPPDALLADLWTMLSGDPAETVLTAMSEGQHTYWLRAPGQPPLYDRGSRGTLLSVGAPPKASITVQREAFVWEKVVLGGMNDETRKTLVYIVAKCVAGSGEEVRIHVNDLLAFRQAKKHHSRDYRPQHKRDERERLWALSQIFVQVNDQVEERLKNGKTRKKNVALTSQLITVGFESEMPLPLDTTPEDVPYGFRIRLGSWATPYMANLPRYVAPLLAKVGQYNPADPVQRIALRLALFLALKWRGAGGTQRMTVRELLRMATIDVPRRNPERFRDYVEAALERLKRDGVIGGWKYDSQATEDEESLSRKWFKAWQGWAVTLSAPAEAIEMLDSMVNA